MSDMNKNIDSEIKRELNRIQSAFNNATKKVNESDLNIRSVNVLPQRIIIGKPVRATESVYECTSKDEVAQLVFGVVCLYFHHVKAHPNEYHEFKLKEIADKLTRLTAFINQYDTSDNKVKFKIIKSFETYLVEQGFGGNYAHGLLYTLRGCQNLKSLSPSQIDILKAIDSATKLNPIEAQQYPLTSWFSQIDWLRAKMAQTGKLDVYQRLGSTKLLMQSFNQTVAELMAILQEVSRDLADVLKQNNSELGNEISRVIDKNKQDRTSKKQRAVLYAVTRGDYQVKQQTLQALIYDFCPASRRSKVSAALLKNEDVSLGVTENRKVVLNFFKAVIFDEEFINNLVKFIDGEQAEYPVSKAEEVCFYWLNCAQTVQASDVRALKYQDFVFHGSSTRTTHLSCDYYKSRAKDFKPTETLDTTQPVGKALLQFLCNRKASKSLLSLKAAMVDHASMNFNGLFFKMFNLLFEKNFNERYRLKLQEQKVSTIFLDLIHCLLNCADITKDKWVSQRRCQKIRDLSIETYQREVKYWLPQYWFTGSMIKTASVHSDSGNYRVNTLVNYNSHTGSTEHEVYFSSQNEEYMNMHGRLMRFVMEDIENIAFKPNLEEVEQHITDRKLRTVVVTETTGGIQSFNDVESADDIHAQGDTITIIDSAETVVNFLHYINQAQKKYKALALHNPEFLEKSVLVEAEWKEHILNNLISKQVRTKGYAAYKQYENMLPELFTSQIRV